jgi:hypothetical protein
LEESEMSNVVESLPEDMKVPFSEIVGAEAPDLLASLGGTNEPSLADRVAVEEILLKEFVGCLRSDNQPTEEGKAVDDLLGQFLLRWPIIQADPGNRRSPG